MGYLLWLVIHAYVFADATWDTFLCSLLLMHVFCGGSARYLSVARHTCMSFAEAAWDTLL